MNSKGVKRPGKFGKYFGGSDIPIQMFEPMGFGEEYKHGWLYPGHIPGGKDEG